MNSSNKSQNRRVKANTLVFGALMLLSQVGLSIIYGVTFQINPSVINTSAIVTAIALAILVIAGFGLVFSYVKKLAWSGIGFNFFITAFCIELYPLINDFWTKTRLVYSSSPASFQGTSYELYLSNFNLPSAKLYGNCITNCLKCALAVSVAFSSILGRAGPLECFLTAIFGTIGYELNRQVIANLSVDGFGTYSIFAFGGFMGLALGLILKFKEDRTHDCSTEMHPLNTSSTFSMSFALFGSLIILALFPLLGHEIDVTNNFNLFNLYNTPTSVIAGMGASIVASIIVSCLINGNIIIRDLVHAPIAGGIVVGSASFYITNPVFAFVAGFAAGTVQTCIQNFFEREHMKQRSVISTISWSLFGIQAIIGGVFATGYKKIIETNSNNFTYSNPGSVNFNPGYQLLIAVISAGIGLGIGIIAGLVIYCVSAQKSDDHFLDRTNWASDDGLTYVRVREAEKNKKVEQKDLAKVEPVAEKPKTEQQKPQEESVKEKSDKFKEEHSQILPLPDVLSVERTEFEFEMDFSEGSEDLPYNFHAYL